jgi:hypothetical protein
LGWHGIDSSSTAQDDHIKGASSSRNSSPVNNTSIAKLEPSSLLEPDTRPDGLEPQAGPSQESEFDSSRRGGKSGLHFNPLELLKKKIILLFERADGYSFPTFLSRYFREG